MHTIVIQGHIKSPKFQLVKHFADQFYEAKKRDVKLEVHSYFEFDWALKQADNALLNRDYICQIDGKELSMKDFIEWLNEKGTETEHRSDAYCAALVDAAVSEYYSSSKSEFVFMKFRHGEDALGQIVLELFASTCPKTCENFKQLCGTVAHPSDDQTTLTYKGTKIHRIQPLGWLQGGDVLASAGNKGCSIYGEVFEDENYVVEHDKRGILSMANQGPHTNSSQFFITFQALPWMNKNYVAFGKVHEGSEVIKKIEGLKTYNQRPLQDLVIEDCGPLEV